ncbi:hypothetical protein BS50DRAFT_257593 [Corynespora cassiicola Philippines]|uniref:Uncharacterized protein n=1 Tax=Corynespora cassiicola Philippines TaxID=1448308 RepID=A0A2T2P4L0_CORCC|nr:hypothetical protein BS50DRAFT_257593 [Corynespora cassiicola Philippines]
MFKRSGSRIQTGNSCSKHEAIVIFPDAKPLGTRGTWRFERVNGGVKRNVFSFESRERDDRSSVKGSSPQYGRRYIGVVHARTTETPAIMTAGTGNVACNLRNWREQHGCYKKAASQLNQVLCIVVISRRYPAGSGGRPPRLSNTWLSTW